MSLEGIVVNPKPPKVESDTFNDNRARVYLLYKNGGRLDALVVPYGVDLKGKKDVTYYLRFLEDGSIISHTWVDAEIEEHVVGIGNKYLTINHETEKAVLPFVTYSVFPSKIMPNSFTEKIIDCNEELLKEFVELFKFSHDVTSKGNITPQDKNEAFFRFSELQKSIVGVYGPLRSYVFDAFKDTNFFSRDLYFLDRKLKHWFWKDVEHYCFKAKSIGRIALGNLTSKLFFNPLKHFYYSTKENQVFDLPKDEKKFEKSKAFYDFLVSELPELGEFFDNGQRISSNDAARIYHKYLFYAGVASFLFGNFLTAGGLLGLFAAESLVSLNNRQKTGFPTSIIGTLRDKLKLTKDYFSPFNKISGDFDLGMWRKKDFE
ncbi:hypothetical protein HZA97_03590 [Candidatus Woesearchaeota archaeon]|nr:hypothetical protein [Candidatus Woesearchaeota archaeon]